MVSEILSRVREIHPLVHNNTNYVTVNDCANIVLACGASPIMADDPEEAEEITAICSGLNLNMGTLNPRRLDAMILSGKTANETNIPVVLDPVGAGASRFRRNAVARLLENVHFSIIRGNASELRALAGEHPSTRGVDVNFKDQVGEENLREAKEFVQSLAKKLGCVIVMSGKIDLVADADHCYAVRNGTPIMGSITGAGCQLSALTAAFAAANPDRILEAALAGVCAMGLAGEIAAARMSEIDGNASFRNYLIDAIYRMTPEQWEKGANYCEM